MPTRARISRTPRTGPTRSSAARGAGRRWAPWALTAALFLLSGCSLRDDPRYNRFSPTGGKPTVLKQADRLVGAAEQALDNAERRFENIVD